MKPEVEALIARGNVTLAELQELRCNSEEWRLLVPALDNKAFIYKLEHCIENCGRRALGTYDEALQVLYGPEAVKRLKALEESLLASTATTDSDAWIDAKDEWSEAIHEAHPTRSESHEQYATAMKMVTNRYSKGAIVALINWLLVRNAKLDKDLKEHRVHLAFASRENLFGVKPDGTPSEASLYIKKLEVFIERMIPGLGEIDQGVARKMLAEMKP